MTYVPQVHLSCNRCLHEFQTGTREIGSVFQAILEDYPAAYDSASAHHISYPAHYSFNVILRSTREIISIEFSPFYNEGAMPPYPENRF